MLGIRAGKFVPGIAAVAACITLALGLTACDGKQSSAVSPQPPDNRVAPPIQMATADSLYEALAELEALPTPEGVDEALWVELKAALGEALNDSCRYSIGMSRVRELVGRTGVSR